MPPSPSSAGFLGFFGEWLPAQGQWGLIQRSFLPFCTHFLLCRMITSMCFTPCWVNWGMHSQVLPLSLGRVAAALASQEGPVPVPLLSPVPLMALWWQTFYHGANKTGKPREKIAIKPIYVPFYCHCGPAVLKNNIIILMKAPLLPSPFFIVRSFQFHKWKLGSIIPFFFLLRCAVLLSILTEGLWG